MANRVWRNSAGLPILETQKLGEEMSYEVNTEHFAHYGVTRQMLAKPWVDWSKEEKKVVSLAIKQSMEDFLRQASRFLLTNVPGFIESDRVQWAAKDCVDNTSVEEVGGALGWSFGESVLASAVRVPSTHDRPCDASHYVLVGDTVDILSLEAGQGREHRWNREVYGGQNSTGMSKRQVSDDLTSKADARNGRMNAGVGSVNVNHIVAMAYARNDRDRVAGNGRRVRARHH
jgi:hypothetical protein